MGSFWNGNKTRPKKGEETGLGKIDSHEMGKREVLRERIRYLTKSDQYLKCKHLVGLRAIGMSRPKQKVKQGRPRTRVSASSMSVAMIQSSSIESVSFCR